MRQVNPSDIDFEKEMARGPLAQSGFTRELRRKIEERIDEQPKVGRPWLQLAGALSFCFVVLAAGLSFQWTRPAADEDSPPPHQAAAVSEPAIDIAQPVSVNSGLLIGLRAEGQESAYRTIYIAPENSRLREIAEGDGILVPYKQQFWKIVPMTHETASDKYQYLVSYPADQQPSAGTFTDRPDEKVTHSEKLLFAANQYISVEETEEISTETDSTRFSSVWTTQIPFLSATGDAAKDPAIRRHVSAEEALNPPVDKTGGNAAKRLGGSTGPAARIGDNWAITRQQGRWVAQAAETVTKGNTRSYVLHDLDLTLPESVVSHDALCCSWTDISAKQPKAVDALSSPENDLVAIMTGEQILIYPKKENIADKPALTIPLKKRETLVMAQWATDHYVDEWTDKVRQYLR